LDDFFPIKNNYYTLRFLKPGKFDFLNGLIGKVMPQMLKAAKNTVRFFKELII